MGIFSRKVDTPARRKAALVFLGAIFALYAALLVIQQTYLIRVRNLQPDEVAYLRIDYYPIQDRDAIDAIVGSLHGAEAFSFTEGGCYRSIRMAIVQHSGETWQFAVARYGSDGGALIQPIDAALPPRIDGQPLYSKDLARVLMRLGVTLP